MRRRPVRARLRRFACQQHPRGLPTGVAVVVIALMAAACIACSDSAVELGTSGAAVSTVGSVAVSRDLAYYEAEIEKTMVALATVNVPLAEADVPLDDPRMAAVYGLRARAQALMAARALLQNDLTVAESAVQQAHVLLARAAATAKGNEKHVVDAAKKLLDSAPKPSKDVGASADMLNEVVDGLAVLMSSQ
jgi:hypothetical protein